MKEINDRGLLFDELFGFRPRPSTTLQLARVVERVNRNLNYRLTGAVFMDVAKAPDTVWVEGLLYKLTVLNFPSYLVKTVSSYLQCRTFQAILQPATSTWSQHAVWCRPGRNCFPSAVQPVCERHADSVSTRLSWSRLAAPPLSSTTWRLTSAGWSNGYEIGGSQRLQKHGDALQNETHPKTQANSFSRRAKSVGRNDIS
jgi:hypothetical protein